MPKHIELLLTETIEHLGIVGDVVKVKPGYARNYLLPRDLATVPTEEKIQQLADRRAEAERELQALREQRRSMIERLDGYELTLERSCNDQGLLYGSVSQQDLATALNGAGFEVRPRDVRLSQTIKRVDTYEIAVKPQADLEATVRLTVVADRKLDTDDEREEMEFDNEGNLIEKPDRPEPAAEAEKAEADSETAESPAS